MQRPVAHSQGRFDLGGIKGLAAHASVATVSGIFNMGLMISLSSLIFLTHCPDYFAPALGFFILGAAVSAILVPILGSFGGMVATVQDVPAVICALMAGSLTAGLAGASQLAIFSNIYVAVGISTLATGVALLVMGRFRLGHLVRFLPHPVIGGFLAASGWLLIKGGLGVSTGVSVDLTHLLSFFHAVSLGQMLSCLALGLVFFLCSRLLASPLWVPGCLVAGVAAFHAVAVLLGWDMAYMAASGWLLGPLPDEPLWRSLALPDMGLVDWPLLFDQAGNVGAIVLLNVISVLLYVSGIEIIARRDLDMNRDMVGTGATNLVVGLLGAPSPFVTASETALAVRMQAGTAWSGILTGGFLALIFLLGGSFLAFFPKFVAGALLFFLGLSFFVEWVVDARKTLPLSDYLVVLAILVCVECFGFLEAIGIGIAGSVIIFTLRYSMVDPVRREDNAATLRSAKDRSVVHQRLLELHAHQMLAFRLQGFLFFGTASALYDRIKARFEGANPPAMVILDLHLMSGEDSSALRVFEKLLLLLGRQDANLLLASADKGMLARFQAGGLSTERYSHLHYFPNLDRAVEWCEDEIILRAEKAMRDSCGDQARDEFFHCVSKDLEAALAEQEFFEQVVERLEPYLEDQELRGETVLYARGEEHANLYFILSGRISLLADHPGRGPERVRSLGPWTLAGAQSFFLGTRSLFTAQAEKQGLAKRLSPEALARMEAEDPALARDFHKLVISLLGRELAHAGETWSTDLNGEADAG